jgi:hypothetical protein
MSARMTVALWTPDGASGIEKACDARDAHKATAVTQVSTKIIEKIKPTAI